MKITDGKIAELRKLLAEATQRPWTSSEVLHHNRALDKIFIGTNDTAERRFYGPIATLHANRFAALKNRLDQQYCDTFARADAALIVAAVNALPELLDEIEVLRAESAHVAAHYEVDARIAELEATLEEITMDVLYHPQSNVEEFRIKLRDIGDAAHAVLNKEPAK